MIRKILFPTDTSGMSNSGFTIVEKMAKKFDANVTLLNIHEEFLNKTEMQNLRVSPLNYQELMKERAVRSREILQDLVKNSEIEERCEIILREGHPRREIVRFAEEGRYDLIIMTSNGRSNLQEQLIGSVSEYVVHHAKVNVMVLRSENQDT